MPFVLLCGFPCSGKTTRALEIEEYFSKNHDVKTKIVSDEGEDFHKNDIFADSKKEKLQRGNLKSEAQRYVNKDDVLILDSLNYIKGFRYELYCAVKNARTPHCVVFCDVSDTQCQELNSTRPEHEQYTEETFNGLVNRFEAPLAQNRWDSPLFVVHLEDKLPLQEMYDALYLRKAPPPNQSTQSPPLAATNFVHELDRITQQIVTHVMDAQKTSVVGDYIVVPGAVDKIILTKILTLAELQRCKRQFTSFIKSRAVETLSAVPNMFVHYINNSIQ